jgi:hypothetical protein
MAGLSLNVESVCQSSKLDDKEVLKYYLQLNLSQSKSSHFSKIFGKRPKGSGRCLSIPLNVRGASMNPFETIRICHWFYFLGKKDQENIRDCHTKQPAREKNLRSVLLHKAVKYLIKSNTKCAAVVEADGFDAASEVGFELLSNEGYSTSDEMTNNENEAEEEEDSLLGNDSSDSNEEDDDVFEHIGIGSSQEQIENFVEESRARVKKTKSKRLVSEAPTKASQLCHAMNTHSEFNLFKKFAKHLDITFVPKQQRNAPKRTAVLILLNEVRDNSNAGGRVRKRIHRDVPKIQVISNNRNDTKYIFSHLKNAYKKETEHLYEVEELSRPNDDTKMVDLVGNYITAKKKERANPPRKRKTMENIANDIDGKYCK